MCRILRSHPVKTIFLFLLIISSVHVIYKLFLTESNHHTTSDDIKISINYPESDNNSKSNFIPPNIMNKTMDCKINTNGLRSTINVNQNPEPIINLLNETWSTLLNEGRWTPTDCISKDNVAIIIPYRNREKHLSVFLRHIHPFLQKQLISYGIFVIEQAEGTRFNRAALFNAGYQEAIQDNLIRYNCFIFHDVDLLPTNENNLYKCGDNPIHLSVAIDKFNYRLPYNSIFGGAVAMSKEQFEKVNGFSNIFYGWGGEDDDMSSRLSAVKFSISRYPNSVSRYVMIRHNSDSGNPANDARWRLLKDSGTRYKYDGINTLKYTIVSNSSKSNLMKFITVQFPEKEVLKQWNL